jgi:hypothetical protein
MRSAAFEQRVADGHDLQCATSRLAVVAGREVVGEAELVAVGCRGKVEALDLAVRSCGS